jgi:hypothetical protein
MTAVTDYTQADRTIEFTRSLYSGLKSLRTQRQ